MHSVMLPPEPASASRAREFVRGQLGRECDGDVLEIVALLATELVTNAVLHARTPLRLTVDVVAPVVRVAVEDTATATPVVRRYEPSEATTGRGLALVEALARSWGIESTADGKQVWCEIELAGARLGER
jgi:anti-sigma regulatory factor (Ser/Thr protein kinase)